MNIPFFSIRRSLIISPVFFLAFAVGAWFFYVHISEEQTEYTTHLLNESIPDIEALDRDMKELRKLEADLYVFVMNAPDMTEETIYEEGTHLVDKLDLRLGKIKAEIAVQLQNREDHVYQQLHFVADDFFKRAEVFRNIIVEVTRITTVDPQLAKRFVRRVTKISHSLEFSTLALEEELYNLLSRDMRARSVHMSDKLQLFGYFGAAIFVLASCVSVAITFIIGRNLNRVRDVLENIADGKTDIGESIVLQDADFSSITQVSQLLLSKQQELQQNAVQLEQARDVANAANLAKSQFLATMSHELRTPLNAILGFSSMMSQEAFGPLGSGRYTEYSQDINSSGQHLLSLIDDILDMSKIEVGKYDLKRELLDLSEMVPGVLKMVEVRAEEAGITLCNQIEETAVERIVGDRRAIMQILINLLTNSIKYSGSRGDLVSISAEQNNEFVTISVEDNGIGISERNLDRVLQPFVQLQREAMQVQEGSGLGLALCKGLTELHGGSLQIESALGVGTTVKITLPIFPFVVWVPSMNIGVDIIDEDHKSIVSMLNAIILQLTRNNQLGVISNMIAEFETVVMSHIHAEEQMMRDQGLDLPERSPNEPLSIVSEIESIQKTAERDLGQEQVYRIGLLVEKWLENHIHDNEAIIRKNLNAQAL